MKRLHALFCACALFVAGAAGAEATPDRGEREFASSCAVCHGAEAKGDGPLRPFLVKPPSDLTTLARRNGGKFPTRDVMDVIDGRAAESIGSHGSRAMPVWGRVYLEQAEEDAERTKLHPEWSVRARIIALLDYLGRVQVK